MSRALPSTPTPTRRTVLGGLLASAPFLGALAAPRPAMAGHPVAPAAAAAAIAPAERAAMAKAAGAFLAAHEVPGLSVAIAKDGRLVYREVFGLADRQAGETLTPRHRFRIASVSKPVTATAVFALVDQGRLRLTDRVFGPGGILDPAYDHARGGPHLDAITVEHLLTHTVGAWPNGAGDPMFREPRWSHAELIARTLEQRPLAGPPGGVFAYSNFGYCLLGRVVEAVGGEPYDAFVRRAVLEPCGVTSMRIAGNTRAERLPDEVVYHPVDRRNPYDVNVARMDAHGGWVATAEDLVRLVVRIRGQDGGAALLRPETVAAMTAPSAVNPRYASGWRLSASGNWWHGGSLVGTKAILVRTRSGLVWGGLCNARGDGEAAQALDRLLWTMVGHAVAGRRPVSDLSGSG